MQVVQAVHAAALPGLRDSYTQALNVVLRKELRLYASSLRKAATASVTNSPSEPDMGLAHKRVCFNFDMLLGPCKLQLSAAPNLSSAWLTCLVPS